MLTEVKNKPNFFSNLSHKMFVAFKSVLEQECQPLLNPQNRCPLTQRAWGGGGERVEYSNGQSHTNNMKITPGHIK